MKQIIYNDSDIVTCQPQSVADSEQDIPMEIRCIVPFAAWIARHPRLSNILIVLGIITLFWVALNYNFTTRI